MRQRSGAYLPFLPIVTAGTRLLVMDSQKGGRAGISLGAAGGPCRVAGEGEEGRCRSNAFTAIARAPETTHPSCTHGPETQKKCSSAFGGAHWVSVYHAQPHLVESYKSQMTDMLLSSVQLSGYLEEQRILK